MDFEELMKKLSESEDFGEDAVNAVKTRLSKPNNEAKNLRIRLKEAESKLSKKNPVIEALSKNGLDIAEDADINESVSDFIASLKANNSTDVDFTKQLPYIKLQKQLEKLEKKSENDDRENAELKNKSEKKEIINSLLSVFKDNISNGETVLDLLVNSNKNPFIVENDKTGFKLDDGDIVFGINEIVGEYKKVYPNQVKNQSKSGAETKPGGTNFQVPKQITDIAQIKAMSAKQISELSPDQNKQMMQVVQEQSN